MISGAEARPQLRLQARLRLPGAETGLGLAIAGCFAVISLLPLARVAAEALKSGGIADIAGAPAVLRALLRSVITSLGGGALSLLIGAAYAVLVSLTDLRLRRFLALAPLLPLLIPAQIIAIAWMQMLSAADAWLRPLGISAGSGESVLYSPAGIILLLGIEHIPVVFLAARATIAAVPRELIEAARAEGAGGGRVFRRIILPMATPGLAAGFGLAVVSCLGSFGIPALIGIPARYPTLAVLIYQRLTGFGSTMLPDASVMALLLAAVAVVPMLLVRWASRRLDTRTIGGAAGAHEYRIALGPWRPLATAALLALSLVVVFLPLLALLTTSLTRAYGLPFTPATATLAHYATVLHTPQTLRAIRTSGLLALAAALAVIALAIPATVLRSWSLTRWLRRLFHGFDYAIDAPYALPGIVLAIGMILLYLPPLPLLGASLYGTPWIILLAYVARFLPVGVRPVEAALLRIDPVMEEAARAQGARFPRRLLRIAAPLLAPAALGAGILVLLTAFGELTVSALLWSPGNETIGVLIFSLNEGGDIAGAAAVSVLCLAFVFAVAGLSFALPEPARRILPWSA